MCDKPRMSRLRVFLVAVAALTMMFGEKIHDSDRLTPPPAAVETVRASTPLARDALTPQNPARCPDGPVRARGILPRKIVDAAPVYPEGARDSGLSGVVLVQLLIGKDGDIAAAKVLRGPPSLDRAAIDAVRRWKYAPTVVNGAPVCVGITVTVDVRP